MRLKELQGCHLRGFARTAYEITKQRTIRIFCRVCWLCTKLWNAIWVSKSTFWSHTWIFSPRKSRRSQWRTRWKISLRHYGYEKAVTRQVDLKYVGRLLLDTEEGCIWRQIPAKVIRLYILEETSCLFRENVKYYVAHLNSSVSLKPCPVQHKKWCSPI